MLFCEFGVRSFLQG